MVYSQKAAETWGFSCVWGYTGRFLWLDRSLASDGSYFWWVSKQHQIYWGGKKLLSLDALVTCEAVCMIKDWLLNAHKQLVLNKESFWRYTRVSWSSLQSFLQVHASCDENDNTRSTKIWPSVSPCIWRYVD